LLFVASKTGQQGPALIDLYAHVDDHFIIVLDPQFKNTALDGGVTEDTFYAPFLIGGNPGRGPRAKRQTAWGASENTKEHQQNGQWE
jgi:hypothetical protein